MTDHTWAQEQIPALIAGGLDPSETARLEAHAAECPTCASDLAAARDFDRQLALLCAPARPTPGLEDRAVLAVRTASTRRKFLLTGWRRNVAAGVAASVGLGVLGAGAGHLVADGRLPVPGGGTWARGALPVDINKVYAGAGRSNVLEDSNSRDPASRARQLGEQLWGEGEGRRVDGMLADLTNDDPGFDSTLPGAVPGFSRPAGGVASYSEGGATKTPPTSEVVRGMTRYGRLREGLEAAPGSERGANQPPDSAHSYFGVMPTDWSDNGRYPRNGPATTTNGTTTLGLGYSDLSNLGGGQPDRAGQVRVEGNTITGGRVGKPKLVSDAPPAPPGSDEGKSEKGKPDPQRTQLGRADYEGLAAVERQPPVPDPAPGDPGAAARRVVIRSGEIEFEVDSFDATVAVVTKLVAGIKGGVVATRSSEKLTNGKMKGYVTVRVPPESLDGLVLDLRKEIAKSGELKGQKIGSQDITKQYIDLESRLKVAKAMETRILQIIKEGKGDIKVLLEAEKQLGEWRTKIEEMEGEIRHYANQVALSSLTVLLVEKEIKAAAGLTESERVQAGVEVEDVETAYRQLLAAVAEAKGRVTKSEMKQLTAGQFSGTIHFEVAPEAAGPVRDRLRQLGRVARLEIDRVQQADSGTVQKDAKIHRGDTQFQVQLYNLANIAPRETAVVQVAVPDVPAAYLAVREAVAKASGRVLVAQLNEQDRQNITAQLDFDIRRTEDGPIGAALTAAGEIVSRQITRAPEGDSVTDAKVLYRMAFVAASRLKPRETTTLAVEVPDVDAALIVLGSRVAEVHGRQVDTNVARERSGRVTAKVVYDVPFASATGLVDQLKLAGTVRVHQTARDPQAPDGKYATARIEVTMSNAEGIVGNDDGLWPPVRRGLSYSASVLLTSLTWVIVGLCVVLPWAIVGIGGYRLIRRFTRSRPSPAGGGSATV